LSDKDKAKSQSSKILSAEAKATLKELKIAELKKQIEELERGSTDDEEQSSPEPEQVQEYRMVLCDETSPRLHLMRHDLDVVDSYQ